MRTLVGRFSTQCLEVATEQDLERLLGQPGRPATSHIQCWRWARDPWGARLGSGQGHRAGVWFCHLADTHRCGEDWVRSHCPSVGPQAVLLKGARVPCPPCERPCCSDLIPVPFLPRLCSSIMSQPPVLLHQDPHGAPAALQWVLAQLLLRPGLCRVRALGPVSSQAARARAVPGRPQQAGEMESVGAAGLASAEFQFCSLAFVSSRREPHQLALI